MLRRDQRIEPSSAATLSHIISAVMFLSMAATINIANTVDDLVQDIRTQVRVLLPR